MKKIILVGIFALVISLFVGCGNQPKQEVNKESKKINIVATLFPQYDFTRQIVGDKANVTLLLPPGAESHSYEPTPEDIIKIEKSDLFIYTGKYMEFWADSIIKGSTNKNLKVLDVSKGIELTKEEDHDEDHDHDDHEDHNDKDHKDEHDEKHEHHHEYDPHIWTSPLLAKKMVDNIVAELCVVDSNNAEVYKQNGENYKKELDKLDLELKDIVKNSKRKDLVFGERFAFNYLCRDYGLTYTSAFDSCSNETEPSAKVVSNIITNIKNKKIPVIYYEELSDPKVAKSISEETGVKMLLLHSCHNLSKDEFNKGKAYLDIMKQNIQNIKEGLN